MSESICPNCSAKRRFLRWINPGYGKLAWSGNEMKRRAYCRSCDSYWRWSVLARGLVPSPLSYDPGFHSLIDE